MVPSFPSFPQNSSFRIPPKYILLFEKISEADFHIKRQIMRMLERTVTIDVKLVYPHAALIFRQFNNRSSVCCYGE